MTPTIAEQRARHRRKLEARRRIDRTLPHPDDAWAYASACEVAIEWRNKCAERLGLRLEAVLRRNEFGGYFRSKELVAQRTLLWQEMRKPMWGKWGGLILSLPEIGNACGCNHSTVVTALKRATIRPAEPR